MKALAGAALIALVATGSANANSYDSSALKVIYSKLNEMCRGGHGDDPATDQACELRNDVSDLLHRHGCAYHEEGSFIVWERCVK